MIATRSLVWGPLLGAVVALVVGATVPHVHHRARHGHHHHRRFHTAMRSPSCAPLPALAALPADRPLVLGDLLNWASDFTCQRIVYDHRVIATGRRIAVAAPLQMTHEQAVAMFHATLADLGLVAVAAGDAIRIIPVAPVAVAPPDPAICVSATITDAATTLSSPVVQARDGERSSVEVGMADRVLDLAVTPHHRGAMTALDVSYTERTRAAAGAWTTRSLTTRAITPDRQPVTLTLPDRRVVLTPKTGGCD
jgi:hypothetical protein